MPMVVVDVDPERVASIPRSYPQICGDASDDHVLRHAGIDRTAALRPDLLIVSGAREDASVLKLLRAGADGVNPQEIGGARIAAFVSCPRVTDLLDVVMPTTRDRDLDENLR